MATQDASDSFDAASHMERAMNGIRRELRQRRIIYWLIATGICALVVIGITYIVLKQKWSTVEPHVQSFNVQYNKPQRRDWQENGGIYTSFQPKSAVNPHPAIEGDLHAPGIPVNGWAIAEGAGQYVDETAMGKGNALDMSKPMPPHPWTHKAEQWIARFYKGSLYAVGEVVGDPNPDDLPLRHRL